MLLELVVRNDLEDGKFLWLIIIVSLKKLGKYFFRKIILFKKKRNKYYFIYLVDKGKLLDLFIMYIKFIIFLGILFSVFWCFNVEIVGSKIFFF